MSFCRCVILRPTHKCSSKVDEACEAEKVTCETGFLNKLIGITDFSTEPSCVSDKYTDLCEEYKFKDCGDLLQDVGFLAIKLFGAESGFSFEPCNRSLCNGDKYVWQM